jgi:hypothetical protein
MGGRFYEARTSPWRDLSISRFKQLELALLFYHEEHGAFPPTKYQPVAGGPIHSWRVLLVPHTSRSFGSYSDYDFSQEWNSTNNLQALGRTAPVNFRFDDDGEIAHYLAIGDGEEWPSKEPLKSRLITKGEDRFLLVEYPDSDIHWMEPRY